MPCQDVPEKEAEPSATRSSASAPTSGGMSESLAGSATPSPEMPPLEADLSVGSEGTQEGKEASMPGDEGTLGGKEASMGAL